jgi:TolB protein
MQAPRAFYQGVSLSPDGRRIGLSAMVAGNMDIYSLRIDGADFKRLTTDSTIDAWESWSPDSRRLLYTAVRPNHTMDIVVMNDDGSAKAIAPGGAGRGGYASWSPDGRRVSYERRVDSISQVFTMKADGTDEQRVSHLPVPVGNARWSLDGKRIAFESTLQGAPDQLYVADADGGHQLQITHDTAFSVFPAWTADGRVAFIRKGTLFVVNADGTNEQVLRPSVSYAVFSSDGKRMAFLGRERGAPRGMFGSRLYIADADGANERVIALPTDPAPRPPQ